MTKNVLNEDTFGGGLIGGGFDNTLAPSSYSVQGQGPGYVYSILPMTDDLQTKRNNIESDYYIHPGCTVKGHAYNNPDHVVTGQVYRIVKRSDGSIMCVYVKDCSNNRFISLSSDGISLVLN